MIGDEHENDQRVAYSPKVCGILIHCFLSAVEAYPRRHKSLHRKPLLSLVARCLIESHKVQTLNLDEEDEAHIRHILQILHDHLRKHGETFSDEILVRYPH